MATIEPHVLSRREEYIRPQYQYGFEFKSRSSAIFGSRLGS